MRTMVGISCKICNIGFHCQKETNILLLEISHGTTMSGENQKLGGGLLKLEL